MIELRWRIPKPTEYDNFIPDYSVRLSDGLDAVLQYRESISTNNEDGTRIHQGWDEWQDVPIE